LLERLLETMKRRKRISRISGFWFILCWHNISKLF